MIPVQLFDSSVSAREERKSLPSLPSCLRKHKLRSVRLCAILISLGHIDHFIVKSVSFLYPLPLSGQSLHIIHEMVRPCENEFT